MKKSFTDTKEVVAKQPSQSYNYKQVVLMVDVRLIHTGAVTGKQYVWEQAGAILPVDERDVPDLLVQHVGTSSCCGGGTSKMIQVI